MAYQNPAAFRDAAKAELDFFKRQDPRPALPVLGWEVKEGKTPNRFMKNGVELALWGGKNPGDFFAFNEPNVRGRPRSIVDLALDHVGAQDWKKACELLRGIFSPSGALGDWTDGSEPLDPSEPVPSFMLLSGVQPDEATASRLRRIPGGFRVPHQEFGITGLSVIGWSDVTLNDEDELRETPAGRIGVWASPSTDCTEIRICNDLADALRPAPGVMRIWSPRGADKNAAALAKAACEKISCDLVTVCARDDAAGDTRRGLIRAALDAIGIKNRGMIISADD